MVEHWFGQTKGRWRCLDKRINEDTGRTPHTIIACCVLHNNCILLQDDFDVSCLSVCREQQNVGEDEVGPQDIRHAIVDYLF